MSSILTSEELLEYLNDIEAEREAMIKEIEKKFGKNNLESEVELEDIVQKRANLKEPPAYVVEKYKKECEEMMKELKVIEEREERRQQRVWKNKKKQSKTV